MNHQPVLLGFDAASSENAVLAQIGLVPDLGKFLVEHLSVVLRKQYPDLEIESIEFVQAGKCNAGGMMIPNSTLMTMTTLALPIHTDLIVLAREHRYKLSLEVTIKAELVGEKYEYLSDVRVKSQASLGHA